MASTTQISRERRAPCKPISDDYFMKRSLKCTFYLQTDIRTWYPFIALGSDLLTGHIESKKADECEIYKCQQMCLASFWLNNHHQDTKIHTLYFSNNFYFKSYSKLGVPSTQNLMSDQTCGSIWLSSQYLHKQLRQRLIKKRSVAVLVTLKTRGMCFARGTLRALSTALYNLRHLEAKNTYLWSKN